MSTFRRDRAGMITDIAPEDPRAVFAHAVRTARRTVAAVPTTRLGDPTPCPDFDVRALLGHLLAVFERVALMGEAGDPMAAPSVVTGVADTGWDAAFEAGAHRIQAAWSDPLALTRPVVLPWAEAPGGVMLAMYTAETTVHTWDLATATDHSPDWHDTVLAVALASSRAGLPPGDRVAEFERLRPHLPARIAAAGPPFGNPVSPGPDARAIDELVAWYGRRPLTRACASPASAVPAPATTP